jgi:predicted thioesterase
MIAAAAVVAFALVAVAIIIGSGSDNDADPDAGTEAASGSEPSSSTDPVTQAPADETTTTVAVAPPSARIDCPTEITLGQRVDCFIISADATSGQWELPGMLDQPLAIELVPGRSQIFLEPTPPIAVGDTFRIVATVVSADGAEVTATHRFEIIGPPETVGPSVRIDCPETVAVGTSVNCDITSANAASGEWSIPEFASGPLETVPGTYAIFIAPDNPSVVGQTFTITATVTNSDGRSATATNHFTVTAAGG